MDFTLNHKLWTFQYRYDHVLGLIFVAIWRKEIVLEYVDKFLDFLRSNFQASSNKIIWKGKNLNGFRKYNHRCSQFLEGVSGSL